MTKEDVEQVIHDAMQKRDDNKVGQIPKPEPPQLSDEARALLLVADVMADVMADGLAVMLSDKLRRYGFAAEADRPEGK